MSYLFFHLLIEIYMFIVPIIRLHGQWNNPNPVVPMHPILHNTSHTLGHITVKTYLIISSLVVFLLMCLTMYISCCLYAWTTSAAEHKELSQEQRERLLEQDVVYKIDSSKPVGSGSASVKANSMY